MNQLIIIVSGFLWGFLNISNIVGFYLGKAVVGNGNTTFRIEGIKARLFTSIFIIVTTVVLIAYLYEIIYLPSKLINFAFFINLIILFVGIWLGMLVAYKLGKMMPYKWPQKDIRTNYRN